MRRSLRLASTALPFASLLTACAAPPEPVIVRPEIPPALFDCLPQPAPPDRPRDDAALASWIVDLASAGDDCRSKLAALKELLR